MCQGWAGFTSRWPQTDACWSPEWNCTLDRLSDNMTYAWVFAWSGNFLNLCILGFLMITCCEYHVLIYCRWCFVHWQPKRSGIQDWGLTYWLFWKIWCHLEGKHLVIYLQEAVIHLSLLLMAIIPWNFSAFLESVKSKKTLGRHSWLKQNKCSGLCLPWLLHGFQM